MPLARPAIIVTSVMVLIFVWNEYLFSTTFLLNENSYTLAGGLYQLQSNDYTRSWGMFSAAAILVSVPVLIIFFCIQKYMVSGLTAGGVKDRNKMEKEAILHIHCHNLLLLKKKTAGNKNPL